MVSDKNLYYYFLGVVFFIGLKLFFTQADNNVLLFILSPLNSSIELITGLKSEYSYQIGFYFPQLNIVIDRSCSGFNFWVISFSVFSFSVLPFFTKRIFKLLVFPAGLLLTYLLTILVNISRILTSISLNQFSSIEYDWLHQAGGASIYLISLIGFYLATIHLLTKFRKAHEKLT